MDIQEPLVSRDHLRRMMNKRGIQTFDQLRDLASLGKNTLTNMFSNNNWRISTLKRIADVLDYEAYELLRPDEQPQPQEMPTITSLFQIHVGEIIEVEHVMKLEITGIRIDENGKKVYEASMISPTKSD